MGASFPSLTSATITKFSCGHAQLAAGYRGKLNGRKQQGSGSGFLRPTQCLTVPLWYFDFQSCSPARSGVDDELPPDGADPLFDDQRPAMRFLQLTVGKPPGEWKAPAVIVDRENPSPFVRSQTY